MSSEGPNSPTARFSYFISGSLPWGSDDAIYAEDGSTAAITNYDRDPIGTYFLGGLDFGFSIPSGATINGIEVEIKKGSSSGVYDDSVSLIKADVPQLSTNYASGSVWPSSLAYVTYGGPSDLWGGTWSDTDINAADFGVGISASSIPSYATAEIDHIRITVYYTEGGGGGGISIPVVMHHLRQQGIS